MANTRTTPTRTTAERAFFSCNPDKTALFLVRDGVPTLDALEMASVFLNSAKEAAYHAGDEAQSDMVYGAAYLIEMSKAIVDAAIEGLTREAREARK